MRKNLLAVSLITIGSLYGILAAVIILAFIIADLPVTNGIMLSLLIIVIQFLIAPVLNDFVFRVFYKTTFDYELPEYLREFIQESCKKHGMKYPKIGFIDDGAPNAFTYGRTKNDARVVITRGVLELLDEEEVKSVVAHELGHANHYDMLFMTVAQIVPLILYYVYELLLDGKTNRGTKRNDSNNNAESLGALVGLIAYILYIVSQYIILWLSRTREYYADSFSIEETENPTALATALIKIGFGLATGNREERSKVSSGNALGISNAKFSKGMAIASYNNGGVSKDNVINAMKWERWSVWAKINELSSTHPLISKRLLAISDRCEEFGQPRYIEFNEKQPESYLDDFFKDLFVAYLPWLVVLGTLIAIACTGAKTAVPLGVGAVALSTSLIIYMQYTHKDGEYGEYKQTTVAELLGEVKVSNVKSIPCTIEGTIIGRGNPGCVFNEDFVIKDQTGIMFLDYNQPLYIAEKLFAAFKSEEYFDKKVRVKGWYRRSVVPYIEVKSMEIDGVEKKCHTYTTAKVIYGILLVLSIAFLIYTLGI